uniref:Uncharacterized protein n=1 Tax=Rhizophora mucronata TaxID=61149 RepID=A0A2P2PMQ6_RHIMU
MIHKQTVWIYLSQLKPLHYLFTSYLPTYFFL